MQISRRACLFGGAAGLAALVSSIAAQEKNSLDEAELLAIMEASRKAHDVPALAAAVIRDGKYAFGAAIGVRKSGDPAPATISDQWHIGSMTKSMTATLCGIFVERGKLTWGDTLADIFPDLAAAMQPEYRRVTLKMLLAQRAGMSAASYPAGYDAWALPANPKEPRLDYLKVILKEKPDSPPGTKYLYSNRNYIIIGAMLERVAGAAWESLVTKELFTPLGMKSAGFGAAGTPGKVEQPLGHVLQSGKQIPIAPGLHADNAPVLGPAGRVHCSLPDLAKFVCEHLRGEQGGRGLLKADTIKFLHTPPYDGEYMAGWIKTERAWGGGAVLWHNGTNVRNYSLMWIAPNRNFGVLTATNFFDGFGGQADKACDSVTGNALMRIAETYPKA